MRALLCATVTAQTLADLRRQRDQMVDADLVELRLDSVSDPDVAGALAGRRTPVIVTCRPVWEGGGFTGSEEERHRLLAEAQRLGAEYVDVEWKAGFPDLVEARGGRGIVLSMHDFEGMPPDLHDRARAMRATGAEIIKLAVTAHRLRDCVDLLALNREVRGPAVVLGMGDAGIASRVLASRFGSCWTYAGEGAAPGQLSLARMRDEFAFRSIGPQTALYGVVGRPVMHSVSPAMHNAAFRSAGLDAVYLPLAAADFDDFLVFADAVSLAGASVTTPYKLAAFEHAAERDSVSRQIESANTLRRYEGRWQACNTDVEGFLAPLQAATDLSGRRAVVLGAGGAARAAAAALHRAGAVVAISARRRDRAEVAARATGSQVVSWPPPPGSWDVLVNATSAGMVPHVHESPMPGGPFTGELVYDLVYNPPDTRLLREAREAGCRTIGGLEMLLAQAERQFEWWTGSRPSADVMRNAALTALAASHATRVRASAGWSRATAARSDR